MVGIGLWIRLGILKTPVFQKVIDEDRVERVPVLEVLKRQPKQVLLRLPEQALKCTEVRTAKLFPLRHDDQCVRTF